jgi:outer membrane autotransporter protein
MSQCTWGWLSGRAWAVVIVGAVAALGLAGPGSDGHAQTFNDAIQGALDPAITTPPSTQMCAGLKGPFQGGLNSICSASGGATGTSAGASIASLTMRQQGTDQRRIQLRLEEQRQASREGGVLAASADPTFELGKLGLFVTGEGDWVRKDVTRFEPGFSSDAGGVMFGGDYRVLTWLTAGLAFSYLNTHGDFTGNNGHFNTNAFGVTLYGSVTPLPNLFVDGTIGYTLRDYDIVRRASYFNASSDTGADGFVQGDTTGNEFRTSVQAGYDFPLGALTVGPRVGVNYSSNNINSYGERNSSPRGLDTGLQLAYDAQHRESLTTTVGAFASYAISTSIGVFVPQLTGEWVHEFLDNQRVIYFRFREDLGQTKLRFQTDPPDRNYANLGTGVVLVLPKGLQVFLSFRALVGYSDRQAYTANGGLQIGF